MLCPAASDTDAVVKSQSPFVAAADVGLSAVGNVFGMEMDIILNICSNYSFGIHCQGRDQVPSGYRPT